MSLSQKDAYTMIFKEYPDVVSVTQMSKMKDRKTWPKRKEEAKSQTAHREQSGCL